VSCPSDGCVNLCMSASCSFPQDEQAVHYRLLPKTHNRHVKRRTPHSCCLSGGTEIPTSAAQDNNKPALLLHSQVLDLPIHRSPCQTVPSINAFGSTNLALQSGISCGVRGVGPTRTLVSVDNMKNQQNCLLLPERKAYIPGSPLGHFIPAHVACAAGRWGGAKPPSSLSHAVPTGRQT
jgi:hypothetical protein